MEVSNIQERINGIIRQVGVHETQHGDKAVDILVVGQTQVPTFQVQFIDEVVEGPVILQRQVSAVQVIEKTVQDPQLQSISFVVMQRQASVPQSAEEIIDVAKTIPHDRVQNHTEEQKHEHEETFQIFVKVLGSNLMLLDVTLSETAGEVKQTVRSKLECEIGDLYIAFEGKGLRGSTSSARCLVEELIERSAM